MNTLFVSALPFRATEDSLRQIFAPYGPIHSIQVFADWENPTFEAYAHIQTDQAEAAILALDGKQIGLTLLRVNRLVQLSAPIKKEKVNA